MSHSHEHCCEHEVKWCKVCQVVYCTKCGKEWNDRTIWYQPYYPPTQPWYIPWNTDRPVTYGASETSDKVEITYGTQTAGGHNH